VPERSVNWVRLSTTDQRGRAGAAKFCNLFATGPNGAGPKGGNAAAQRIQDVTPAGCLRDSAERSSNLARAAYLARASTWVMTRISFLVDGVGISRT